MTGDPPSRRLALGASGEELAARWYAGRGYRVLARNWRSRQGELDLVVGRPGLIVFSEVKTRRSRAFGEPFEAVTPAKRARLRRLAAEYLRVAGRSAADDGMGADMVARGPVEVRFDVVSILGSSVEVLEGAF